MLRAVPLLLAALVLCAATATASPISVAYTPKGVSTDDPSEYYLKATLREPEAPRRGFAERDDCASSSRPPSATGAANVLVQRLARIDPSSGTFSQWFPECAGVPVGQSGTAGAYASYNVTSGRYYVESPFSGPVGPERSAAAGYSGTTGLGLSADCVGCPPPTCC